MVDDASVGRMTKWVLLYLSRATVHRVAMSSVTHECHYSSTKANHHARSGRAFKSRVKSKLDED